MGTLKQFFIDNPALHVIFWLIVFVLFVGSCAALIVQLRKKQYPSRALVLYDTLRRQAHAPPRDNPEIVPASKQSLQLAPDRWVEWKASWDAKEPKPNTRKTDRLSETERVERETTGWHKDAAFGSMFILMITPFLGPEIFALGIFMGIPITFWFCWRYNKSDSRQRQFRAMRQDEETKWAEEDRFNARWDQWKSDMEQDRLRIIEAERQEQILAQKLNAHRVQRNRTLTPEEQKLADSVSSKLRDDA